MVDFLTEESAVPFLLDGHSLTIDEVVSVARHRRRVRIAPRACIAVARCRALVDVLLEADEKVYGVTTGFGILRDIKIARADADQLQINLIRSHAAGVGQPFPEDVVRAAMLLRANTLCRGNSGVRLAVPDSLVDMLNDDVFPYIPSKGSVGASGDLAPLSHLALALVGDPGGRFYPRRRRGGRDDIITQCDTTDFQPMPESQDESVLAELKQTEGWKNFTPIRLQAKEGLALNNGTPIMSAILCLAVHDATLLMRYAELAAAMSLEANQGMRAAYRDEIHQARPQEFQQDAARHVMAHCAGSQIIDFCLNSAQLRRAQIALDMSATSLRRTAPDGTTQTAEALQQLAEFIFGLVPRDAENLADAHWVNRYSALPVREQIASLQPLLAPAITRIFALLKDLQDPSAHDEDAGAAEARRIAEAGLLKAWAALREAVPASPAVQDDYSFRCFPQVIAGAHRALDHVRGIVAIEINAATDNPLLFPFAPPEGFESLGVAESAAPEQHRAAYYEWLKASPERQRETAAASIGGGNFHGQPLATAADYLSIALAEVANISERRIAHLVDEKQSRGLPAFLIENTGLNSGFMIPQYTAAALVSENKVYCHPASVDSIPTCANSEDHVSMGTFAARKCAVIVENIRFVVAIEMLAAYLGLHFRRPLRPGAGVWAAMQQMEAAGIRQLDDDRVMYPEIQAIADMLKTAQFADACRTAGT